MWDFRKAIQKFLKTPSTHPLFQTPQAPGNDPQASPQRQVLPGGNGPLGLELILFQTTPVVGRVKERFNMFYFVWLSSQC